MNRALALTRQLPHDAAYKMSNDGSSKSSGQSPTDPAAPTPQKSSDRPTTRTALRDLERTQFDALEQQLRDLER